jgi:hypothetical protein
MPRYAKSLLLAFWATAFFAVGSAMAAESSPAIILPAPFANIFADHPAAVAQPYLLGTCRIGGEQAEEIERRTSDPCLAADASPGNVCFDRLGFGTLRAQRPLLPNLRRQHCVE